MITLFEAKEKAEATTVADRPPPKDVTISSHLIAFFSQIEANLKKQTQSPTTTIRVSDVLGSIAYLYERIRNTVEYKGEHVLRRNAIERILKRILWERPSHHTEQMAKVLIRELIWARYLPNDAISKNKINQVSQIINKYLYLLGKLQTKGSSVLESARKTWVWGVASCEIEEALDPSNREPYVELMFTWFMTRFDWQADSVSLHEKQVQKYLAIHRSLAKSDDHIMRFHLLIKEFPNWDGADEQVVDELVEKFAAVYQEIETHLHYKDRFILYRIVQKNVAAFEVFRTLIKREKLSDVKTLVKDEEQFEKKIREICQIKYNQIQKKVHRGIFRSILYIFVTKVLLALLFEIPYELYRFGRLTPIPLAVNMVIPPAMMAIIGATIKTPGEDNTQRIIARLKSVAYSEENPPKTVFSLAPTPRSRLIVTLFTLIYLILFAFVFGGITYILIKLQFTLLGIMIFFVFLSLVLLFGFRVRFTAEELTATSVKEGIVGHLFNNLTLPFLRAGVSLSRALAKINVFTIILDFLIEAPLKTIIEVVEEWTSFVREKREEIVEVPDQ